MVESVITVDDVVRNSACRSGVLEWRDKYAAGKTAITLKEAQGSGGWDEGGPWLIEAFGLSGCGGYGVAGNGYGNGGYGVAGNGYGNGGYGYGGLGDGNGDDGYDDSVAGDGYGNGDYDYSDGNGDGNG